ncbi:protein involved in gliding motility EpsA [Pontibacter ummariensis]|uniref:Polysaccharide export outer membrane protein n=2 Tax=Pontibacter ummariensis TaxID=1610492 RepID=A0A239BKW3_9BACT|nr:protein involved in gliding motility EpsA [Pontibacter ummariensis]SNS08506.1 polysaccharide export outer membrane protein [Pontibacter ummariensis]
MRHTLSALWVMLGVLFFSSCVSQKKIVLLQQEPALGKHASADELLKTYELKQPVYLLKPGDVLSLKVQSTTPSEYDFLSKGGAGSSGPMLDGYTLDSEGNMLLPVVGKISLHGLSLPQARSKVTTALQPYLTEPTVNLRLLTFRFTILGEVGGQGQYTTYQDNLNVLEAIAMAGGFSPYSDRGRIRLIRSENGQAKLYTISLLEDKTMATQNFYLQPNDMLVVDPLPAKFVRENVIGNVGLTVGLVSSVFFLISRLTQ